jgi:hypothetical protein
MLKVAKRPREMSTDRQISANQINAQKSTGPRTPTGKARVSSNALTHGLTGKDVVLPNENALEFESFRVDLLTSLAPQGDLESMLAEKIVADAWRLRRVPKLEAAIYRRSYEERILEKAQDAVRQYEMTEDERTLASLREKKVQAVDRQAHEEAAKMVKDSQTKLDDASLDVARALRVSESVLSNLWRHEVALSRSMLRTLHEFQRLQAAWAGEYVAPPEVVDVNIHASMDDHDRE